MLHIVRRAVAVTLFAGLLIPAAGRSQTVDPVHDAALIGDGAAACAAAKRASSARAPRASYSVASANFDASYYHLDLTLPMTNDSLRGVVRIEGTVTGSPLGVLTLDLAPSMIVDAVQLGDGTPLIYSHPGAELNITLPGLVAPGGRVAVDVSYAGEPVSDGFGNFVFGSLPPRRGGSRYAWSLSEPYGAREWWPCKDHPSDKADSVRVTVTVPSAYRVGSQGALVDEIFAASTTTYDWVSRYPISSYLVSVAIGEYVRYQDVYHRPVDLAGTYGPLSLPLDHLVYSDGTSDLPPSWSNTADGLAVLEDWFGPYPFAAEKYGHAEFTFGGAMEHQTMSSIGLSATSVVVHELAHQWYGDSVSLKSWPHLWLNEGFATYAELIYWEDRAGIYPGALENAYSSRYGFAREATGTLLLQDTTSVDAMFDFSRVYAKGAMVVSMLRHVVGDADFRDILRAYASDPAVIYGVGTTNDLKRIAETVSGEDLDSFFRQWVTEGTGYPSYSSSSVWQASGAGYHVWVTLAQTQTASQSNVDVFVMPVDIAVRTAAGEERVRVQNDQRTQDFEFDVADEPTAITIDPDRRILRADQIATTSQPLPPYPVISWLGPNPSVGSFQVQYLLDRESRVTIDVFDVGGRRVSTSVISSAAAGIQFALVDTSPFSSGVYFLRLSTPQGEATRKFVVVR